MKELEDLGLQSSVRAEGFEPDGTRSEFVARNGFTKRVRAAKGPNPRESNMGKLL